MMRIISRTIQLFLRLCNMIAGMTLISLMLLITLNIILRIFKVVIPGSVEITANATTVIAFMGFGYCALRNGHIKVDLIQKWPWLDRVYAIVSFMLLCVVGYCCAIQGVVAYRLNLTTTILHFVRYPFYFVTMLGFISMAFAIIDNEYTYYLENYRLRNKKLN